MRIFNLDGGLIRTLTKIVDLICLSILFCISCIPVFTIGTAYTALYYTVNKVIKNDRGYIFKEYVNAFKNNFKQTTPVWLLVMLLGAIVAMDVWLVQSWGENGSRLGVFEIVFWIIGAALLVWALYIFAYMARFENTRKQTMKNAAIMAVLHLPWTLLQAALAAIVYFILYMQPLSVLVVPGVFVLLENRILEKIFWKYMSEEDQKAELERNREFKN